jgi:hypothetical protein
MDYVSLFPTFLRYIVLAGLYYLVFANYTKVSIQFILFMVIFILNFFTIVFICSDILSTPELVKNLYGLYNKDIDGERYENKNGLVKIFVLIILATALLFVCSFSIILAVFDYGKKKTNDYTSYKMTPVNTELLNNFEYAYHSYLIYLAVFVYIILLSHMTGKSKVIMLNMGCIILSIIIIWTSVYCCYLSANFLNVKKYKKQLYQ